LRYTVAVNGGNLSIWRKTITLDLIFGVLTPLSAISWQPVLVVEEAGVAGENHQPCASNW
jgi:hypothetical protein